MKTRIHAASAVKGLTAYSLTSRTCEVNKVHEHKHWMNINTADQ